MGNFDATYEGASIDALCLSHLSTLLTRKDTIWFGKSTIITLRMIAF